MLESRSEQRHSDNEVQTSQQIEERAALQPMSKLLFDYLTLAKEVEEGTYFGNEIFRLKDNELEQLRTQDQFMDARLSELEGYLSDHVEADKAKEWLEFIHESLVFQFIVLRFCSPSFQAGVKTGYAACYTAQSGNPPNWPSRDIRTSSDENMACIRDFYSSSVTQVAPWLARDVQIHKLLNFSASSKSSLSLSWQRVRKLESAELEADSPLVSAILAQDVYTRVKDIFFWENIQTPTNDMRRSLRGSRNLRFNQGKVEDHLVSMLHLNDERLNIIGYMYGALKGSSAQIYQVLKDAYGLDSEELVRGLFAIVYPRLSVASEIFPKSAKATYRDYFDAQELWQKNALNAVVRRDTAGLLHSYVGMCIACPWSVDERIKGPGAINELLTTIIDDATENQGAFISHAVAASNLLSPIKAHLLWREVYGRGRYDWQNLLEHNAPKSKDLLKAVDALKEKYAQCFSVYDYKAIQIAIDLITKASQVDIGTALVLREANYNQFFRSPLCEDICNAITGNKYEKVDARPKDWVYRRIKKMSKSEFESACRRK